MDILGALLGKVVQKRVDEALKAMAADYPAWALQTAGSEKYNLPDPSVYSNQADLYRKLSWVLTAVDMTAQTAATTPFSVARVTAGKEPKDIPNHPFELLLQNPNPLDSRFEFLYATTAAKKLTGNAYWWLNRPGEKAPPDELWFIPPHMIAPVPDERMFLRGYMYYPGDGQEIFLEPWEILHFKRFNPFSRFVGLSAIESIAVVATGDLKMAEWNTKLFAENNARLPGILAFKDVIADSTWSKIKEDTREASRRREMLMLRGVGDSVSWMQNAVSQKEMEFLEGRQANRDEIWSVLAPGLISMLSENATEANSRTGRAVFNELTVYPDQVAMAEKITSSLLTAYPGRPLLGRFEDIRVTDRQLELQELAEYSKSHTIDEIREEKYGDKPIGDERGQLLPVQVKAESGGIQEAPEPVIQEPVVTEQQEPEEQEETAKATLDELARMQRKALKRIGKTLDFQTDLIPAPVVSDILGKLPACGDADAVKAVFDEARSEIQAKPNDAATVLEAIRLGIEGLKNAR